MRTHRTAMVWMAVGATLLALAGATSAPVPAGVSVGTSQEAGEAGKAAATQAALKDAIERTCADFLRSQAQAPNRDRIFDQVLKNPAAFTNSWSVRRAEFADGAWTVEVAAEVSPEKFVDQWKLTYFLVNSPRLMVTVTEDRDGQAQTVRTVQAAIERLFLQKGFRLVDKAQFTETKEVRMREAALADDLAAAAAVARDFGAELLVVGHARAEKADVREIGTVKFQFYSAEASVKAIQIDSAALLMSDRTTAGAGSQAPATAAARALEQLGQQVATKTWQGIVGHWDKMLVGGRNRCEVRITGVPAEAVGALEKALKAVEGVTEVNLRAFREGAAHFDVSSGRSARDLFNVIVEKKALAGVEVTGFSENIIQGRWVKEST